MNKSSHTKENMSDPTTTIRQAEKAERDAIQLHQIWFNFDIGKLYNEERRVDGIKFVDRGYDVLCVVTAVDADRTRWVAFTSSTDWLPALIGMSRKLRGNLLDWRVDKWRQKK